MPRGVYKKTREHIDKVVGNLTGVNGKPPWNKGEKGVGAVGVRHGNWKGDTAGYSTVHAWLRRHFGQANTCENGDCKKISKSFHWALLKGKKYVHERENFWMLCASCHAIYDEFKAPDATGNTWRRIDLVGQRFGKLVVTKLMGKNKWGNLKFLCECDCGGQKTIPSANLKDGRTKSCGCITMNRMLGNQINRGRAAWNKGKKFDKPLTTVVR